MTREEIKEIIGKAIEAADCDFDFGLIANDTAKAILTYIYKAL